MPHKYLFHDGFETQDASRWESVVGGAVELTTTFLSRAARRYSMAAAGGYVRAGTIISTSGVWDVSTGVTYVWMSCHLFISALPGVGQFLYLMNINRGASIRAQVRINGTTGKMELFAFTTATWEAGSLNYTVETGKWYTLSFLSGQNLAPQFILRDANSGTTLESKTHAAGTHGNVSADRVFFVNDSSTTSTGNVVIDNCVIEADPTLANIDDPVNDLTTRYASGMLKPIADGFYTEGWSGSWADVDEAPHDSDATFRALATAVGTFTVAFERTSTLFAQPAVIKALMYTHFSRNLAAGNTNVGGRMRSGTVDTDSPTRDPGATYSLFLYLFQTDPGNGGSPWIAGRVDEVQAGVRRSTTANTTRTTAVWVEILYTVGDVRRIRTTAFILEAWDPEKKIIDARTGHRVPYNEVRPNRWMRHKRKGIPSVAEEESFFDMEDMFYIESVVYEQVWGKPPRLGLRGPDDLISDLIERITRSGMGL